MDPRQQWMAFVLQQGLEYQLITTEDVLRYATPRVIAGLPVELKSRLLRSGLNQGMFNPDVVLSVLTPEVLASNVPLPTLWGCVAEAGERVFGGDSVNVTGSDFDGSGGASRSSSSSSSSASSGTGRAAASAATSAGSDPSRSTPRPASSGTGSVRTTGSSAAVPAAASSATPAATSTPAAAAAARGTSGPPTFDLDGPPGADPFAHIEGDSMIVIEDEPSHDFASYGAENTGVDHRTLRPSDAAPADDERERARKRNSRL